MKGVFLALGVVLAVNGPAQTPVKPSTARVLGLADLYLDNGEKKLADEDKTTFRAIKNRLISVQLMPAEVKRTIESLVNQLTGALASMQSANGLTVLSAFLVKVDPDNPRVTNLFGAVLNSTKRFGDAVKVLELTLAQSPTSRLAMLNLANAYLDANKDVQAKTMLDQLLKLEPENREAYKVLAAYWFKKGNIPRFHEALLKSANFGGYVSRKTQETDKPIDANEVASGDSLTVMEAKTKELEKSVPLTTADLLEPTFPTEAKKIREKFGRLLAEERMTLPAFPQVNTSSNKAYAEQFPIVGEWLKVISENYAEYAKADALQKTGISTSDSEAEIEKKAQLYAQQEMSKALQGAQDAMKFLKGVKGVDPGMVNQALGQVGSAAKQHGVKLVDRPVDQETPPGYDSGSIFAKANYRQYLVISHSYESYITKIFDHFQELERDNAKVYLKKVEEQNAAHRVIQDPYDQIHEAARTGAIDDAHYKGLPKGHDGDDIICLKEKIRVIKAMNAISETYFKLWVNLYVPQYTQKMKPMLEGYWGVCALYIRNMNDLEVVIREYQRVKAFYMNHALMAATPAGNGLQYAYATSTEEEEAALATAIKVAEAEAEAKRPVFLKEYHEHKIQAFQEKPGPDDWVFWTGQKFDYTMGDGKFLSLHVTARSIDFNAWAFGTAAGMKVEFEGGNISKLSTNYTVGLGFEVGIKVGGIDLTAGGSADFGGQTATWDFKKGTYVEGFPEPKGASLKLTAAAGNLAASTDVKYDPTTGLSGSASANLKAGFGPINGKGEIMYVKGQGLSGSSSLTSAGGPVAGKLSTEFDAQLRVKQSGTIAVGGKTVYKDESLSKGP